MPLNAGKPSVAYQHGVKRITRNEWLKDPLRTEIARNLELPSSFASLDDAAAVKSMPVRSASMIGLGLAVGAVALALVAYLIW